MFEDLLQPISDDQPGGEYLKDNRALYRGYRNAFNVAQSSFRQLVETPEATEDIETVHANSDNWTNLASECHSCLQQYSKDVEILSWYTVSQVFTADPLVNLVSALATFEQIINQYWDSLQPILPEKKRKGATEAEQAKEVVEHRVKPLLQLVGDTAESGLLYMPLQMLPLVGDIDYGKFYAAEKAGSLAEVKQQAAAQFSAEKAEVEVKITTLAEVLEALAGLEKAIGEKCHESGATGVSFRFVKESIERLISAMKYLVGDQFSVWPLDVQPPTQDQPAPVTTQSNVSEHINNSNSNQEEDGHTPAINQTTLNVNTAQGMASREQALAELQKIADYFQQTEPHSPIYLLLKRAIRWGGMSLPELLQELVGDQESVNLRIQQLAGLESAEHQASLNSAPSSVSAPIGAQVNETQASSAVSMPLDEPTQGSVSANPSSNDGGLSQIEW